MSRKASFALRHQPPSQRQVRFPDEVVFQDCVKEPDTEAVARLLRRVSADIHVNRINSAGMTALHQAVLDDNLPLVRILVEHGADVNIADDDSWTPLHAAAANGHHRIVNFLLERGAEPETLTEDGETALDLVDIEE